MATITSRVISAILGIVFSVSLLAAADVKPQRDRIPSDLSVELSSYESLNHDDADVLLDTTVKHWQTACDMATHPLFTEHQIAKIIDSSDPVRRVSRYINAQLAPLKAALLGYCTDVDAAHTFLTDKGSYVVDAVRLRLQETLSALPEDLVVYNKDGDQVFNAPYDHDFHCALELSVAQSAIGRDNPVYQATFTFYSLLYCMINELASHEDARYKTGHAFLCGVLDETPVTD